MKYAYFNKNTGQVLAWLDTDTHNHVLPDASMLHTCTDEEWTMQTQGPMAVVKGAIVPYDAPAPTAAALLAEAQSQQIKGLNAACAAAITAGQASSALGSPHTYPTNLTDQANLQMAVTVSLLNASNPAWSFGLTCQDATGEWANNPHTAAQVQLVANDVANAIASFRMKNSGFKAQVEAAGTMEDVQKVVWL